MNSTERRDFIQKHLEVVNSESNPRSLVLVEFCFDILTYAIDEKNFPDEKTIELFNVTLEAIQHVMCERELRGIHAAYQHFSVKVRQLAMSSFSSNEISEIVVFIGKSFFRVFGSYEFLSSAARTTKNMEAELCVEIPFPPSQLEYGVLLE
jgi:hypothetical protein